MFLSFLDHCAYLKPQYLFLVGDIFDLWISNRAFFVQAYAEVIDRLRRLKAAGTKIYYFEGNHDLDLKKFWGDQMGFEVFQEAENFELFGHRVRVEHGDQMDPGDRGYLFLRWLLRTPVLVGLQRYLPNAFVKQIGQRASRASRDYTTNTKSTTEDRARAVIETHARSVFQERPFDIFISGHVHVSEDRVLEETGKKFRCLNLGTWLTEPLVFDLSEGGGELRPLSEFLNL
jgi:UDP-2,3-diacylglucosamine hydrolase